MISVTRNRRDHTQGDLVGLVFIFGVRVWGEGGAIVIELVLGCALFA